MGDGDKPVKPDPTSPFYLGPQDKSGDFISPVRLKLNNFDDWSHAIRVALRSRRKFGFLNGTITTPGSNCSQDDWETIHCMLVSCLMNTIDDEVKSLLSNYDDAKRLWDDLHERFSVINGPHIQQLKADMNACKQTPSMSVAVYYGKLHMLWDDLDKHEPLITCTCSKCDCDVGKRHAARRDSDRLHDFLLGLLPGEYGTVRSVLLSQDPLPTLNRAFQIISQEERVRNIDTTKDSAVEVAGFAVRSHSRPAPRPAPRLSRTEKQALICSHCNKRGHDENTCFDLLDEIPDWWYYLKGAKPQDLLNIYLGFIVVQDDSRQNVITLDSEFPDLIVFL